MIVPSTPSPQASFSPESFLYEIVESDPLPVVDLSRSIRSVWFSESVGKKWMYFIVRFKGPILGGYYSSIVLYFFGFFTDAETGQRVGIAVISMGIWGALASITLLRADIVSLLSGTYEVWFFTAVNTLPSVLLGMYFADLRALLMPPFWLGVQASVFLDANITNGRHVVLSSLMVIGFLTVLISFIGLGILDSTHSYVLYPSQTRAMTAEVALVNGWSTVALLFCRNVYRRREALKMLGSQSRLVQCISFRVKIKLVRVQNLNRSSMMAASPPRLVRTKTVESLMLPVQMKLVSTGEYFDAANTMIPLTRIAPIGAKLPLWLHLWALGIALTGLCLTCCAFVISHSGTGVFEVELGSLVFTACCSASSLALCQRQLLRCILFSFDYAFLSFQITVAHLSMCDLLYWDHRCFSVGASLLWMHWVITLDAITPVTKHRWGIRVWFAAVVMLLFIVAHVGVVICVVFDVGVDFQDRSVYDVQLWGRAIQVRMVPLLLGRLVVLVSWSCRVLWRIWRQTGDELIIVQGGVIFEGNLRSLRNVVKNVDPATAANT